jgi:crotonobetainyl-CoA:carnitine CoA-transferase CaiB-like acyl-CoA transferase
VLHASGLTLTIDHPLFGSMVRAAPPVAFSDSEWRVDLPCQRGEHNRLLLAELGYDDAMIADLEDRKVVVPMTPIEPLPAEVR